VRKGDIGGELATAHDQRAILEALHRTTDDAHIRPYTAVGVLYSDVVPGRAQ
jgi:hypothetical protein